MTHLDDNEVDSLNMTHQDESDPLDKTYQNGSKRSMDITHYWKKNENHSQGSKNNTQSSFYFKGGYNLFIGKQNLQTKLDIY